MNTITGIILQETGVATWYQQQKHLKKVEGKYVDGIQKVTLEQDFCLIMHLENQIESVNAVAPQNCILHVDSTGSL